MNEDSDRKSNNSCDGSFALSNTNPQQRISSTAYESHTFKPTTLDEDAIIGYNEDLNQAGIKNSEISDDHFRGKESYTAHISDSIDGTYMYNVPMSDRCDDNGSCTHRHEIGEMAINYVNSSAHCSNNYHTNSFQIKIEPKDFEMGKSNASTGTIFGENVMGIRTDEYFIKDEPDMDNPSGPSYYMHGATEQSVIVDTYDPSGCILTDSGERLFGDGVEKGNSHDICKTQICFISNDTNYADCMKNEPYAYDYESNKKFRCGLNNSEPCFKANDNYDTPFTSHVYDNSGDAVGDTLSRDNQQGSEPIKREIHEFSVQTNAYESSVPHDSSDICESVRIYHDQGNMYSTKYAGSHCTRINLTKQEEKQTGKKKYKGNMFDYSTVHKKKHAEEKPYKCEFCSYSTKFSGHFATHTRKHNGDKPYECGVCSYKTNSSTDMAKHERKHMGEKPYTCDECSFSTASSRYLTMHKNKHTREKSYTCDECSFSTVWSGYLEMHKRKHTGEKPYKCDVCSYSTIWSRDLARHKKKHTGEKRYLCDICSFSTIYPGHFKVHKRKHSGEKPYKCSLCSYSTNWPADIAKHKRKHTGEEPYKCDVCNYSSISSGNLAAHKRTHKKRTTQD